MTLKAAIKLLPKSCRGLSKNPLSTTIDGLREVVINELQEYQRGENPISHKQVISLRQFLVLTSN